MFHPTQHVNTSGIVFIVTVAEIQRDHKMHIMQSSNAVILLKKCKKNRFLYLL